MMLLFNDIVTDEHAARARAKLEEVGMPEAAVIVVNGGQVASIAGPAHRAGYLPVVMLALNLTR